MIQKQKTEKRTYVKRSPLYEGQIVGERTLIKKVYKLSKWQKVVYWECKCSCGRVDVVLDANLKTGVAWKCRYSHEPPEEIKLRKRARAYLQRREDLRSVFTIPQMMELLRDKGYIQIGPYGNEAESKTLVVRKKLIPHIGEKRAMGISRQRIYLLAKKYGIPVRARKKHV